MQRDEPRWPPKNSLGRSFVQGVVIVAGIATGAVSGVALALWSIALGVFTEPDGLSAPEVVGPRVIAGIIAGVLLGLYFPRTS